VVGGAISVVVVEPVEAVGTDAVVELVAAVVVVVVAVGGRVVVVLLLVLLVPLPAPVVVVVPVGLVVATGTSGETVASPRPSTAKR
jgi:hypothetical protein